MALAALVLSSPAGLALAGVTTTTTVPTTTSTVTTVTTVTTITSTSTTTTTLPPCTDEATFESTSCRIGELSDAVAAQPELASLAAKLQKALDKAQSNVDAGNEQCNAGDTKGAIKRLKKTIRRLIQYGFKLRSLNARRTIPDEVRTPFIDEGKAILQDVKTLRKAPPICPPASPSGAFVS